MSVYINFLLAWACLTVFSEYLCPFMLEFYVLVCEIFSIDQLCAKLMKTIRKSELLFIRPLFEFYVLICVQDTQHHSLGPT